jgi:Raf kinase inhibitor-like YbhB/YbcL family protein
MRLAAFCTAVAAAIGLVAAPSCAYPSFTLASTAFSNGGTIPNDYSFNADGCTGKNLSPELHWSGAPKNTASYALTVFDPDARKGAGFWHWVLFNVAGTVHALPAGTAEGDSAATDFGTTGYGGPCPPVGDAPHHYIFTLYALDEKLDKSSISNGPDLVKALEGHVLARARLVGRFGR